MRIDLHIHTTASDGAWSPRKVVREAGRGGLDLIAIADHDTTQGFAAAERVGVEERVQVVPAMEISATYGRTDVHILGYFIDPEAPAVRRHAAEAGTSRDRRMREMVGRLRGEGVAIGLEEVLGVAGPDRVSVGRPHLARALVNTGAAVSVQDAFDRYIGDGCPSYVPVDVTSPQAAVRLVLEAGGVPVWAHPPSSHVDGLLAPLMGAGLRGLEVYRPSHSPAKILRLEELCRAHDLIMSGGSDWHTPETGAKLGDFYVDAFEIEPLLEAGGY